MRADILLRCPSCNARLVYDHLHGTLHFYSCIMHGAIVMPSMGVLRLATGSDLDTDNGSSLLITVR